MKKLIYLFALALFFAPENSNAQSCNLVINPWDTIVCPGDSIDIQAWASITVSPQSFDFNTGTLPPGWVAYGGTTFSSPCGPSPSGTPYYWASTTTGLPGIETASYDVSCGGSIQWDMIYEVQGGSVPCEGPDQFDEGVQVQYSTDGGLTWVDIIYYAPNGTTLISTPVSTTPGVSGPTPLTVWDTYTIPIPVGAMTTGTKFRWVQFNSSGTCCDNWGIEDVFVNGGPCGSAFIDWSNGTPSGPGGSMWEVYNWSTAVTNDTMFIAYVYDTMGVLQCQDTMFINLYTNTMSYDLIDDTTIYCPNEFVTIGVENMTGAQNPVTYDWYGPNGYSSTTNPTDLPGSTNEQDYFEYYVDITDGCGFVHQDTVVVITNKILTIDSLVAIPASSCAPEGEVTAYVSGVTQTVFNPILFWEDSTHFHLPPAGNFQSGNYTWSNVAPGWYYFTIQDEVCESTDSVYVDMLASPIADFSVAATGGCDPLAVTFINESSGGVSYEWNFGSGPITVNNMDDQNYIFNTTTVVTLVAYDEYGCPSAPASGLIDVWICGCTDPEADNYDPNAYQDDGSCFYPKPSVITPNIFTPNGDGINDYFELKLKNAVNLELLITNRWGNVVFEKSFDLTAPGVLLQPVGWTGTTQNGAAASEGTYFFTYVVTGIDGDQLEGQGFVQLVRQ